MSEPRRLAGDQEERAQSDVRTEDGVGADGAAQGQPDEVSEVRSFADLGLSQATLAAVDDMGYTEPTPVQAEAIPAVLEGKDVMAAAQTGTGKTAAFLLPCLDRLGHARGGGGPLMLVVTPTRELAQQIYDVAKAICRRTRHQAYAVVGGVGYEPQRKALRRGLDLLVATPGRLIDLMNQGDAHLDQVEVLVLDEADRMLDMGFLPDMRKIVAAAPQRRQTLLFSATLDASVLKSTGSLLSDPVRVEIAHRGTTAETVTQYALGVGPGNKVGVLKQILELEGTSRVIVFTNGKHRADYICSKLRRDKISCAPIHGDRSQNQRARALKEFSDGKVDVLVATDVLARGIDVPDVSYVINYDVPRDDPEDYIHRVGRTGRAGEQGWSVTLVSEDQYLELRDVEALLGEIIPPYPRAGELDLGDDAFVPDPERSPYDKLPGKKARTRIAKRQKLQKRQHQAKAERERKERRAKAHGELPRPPKDGEPFYTAFSDADEQPKPSRSSRRARAAAHAGEPAVETHDEETARRDGHRRGHHQDRTHDRGHGQAGRHSHSSSRPSKSSGSSHAEGRRGPRREDDRAESRRGSHSNGRGGGRADRPRSERRKPRQQPSHKGGQGHGHGARRPGDLSGRRGRR